MSHLIPLTSDISALVNTPSRRFGYSQLNTPYVHACFRTVTASLGTQHLNKMAQTEMCKNLYRQALKILTQPPFTNQSRIRENVPFG